MKYINLETVQTTEMGRTSRATYNNIAKFSKAIAYRDCPRTRQAMYV